MGSCFTAETCSPYVIDISSPCWCTYVVLDGKVKWPLYRPGVVQRVCSGIALLFHDRGTRKGWVFSSTPRPHSTPGKDSVPIVQEAGWAPGPVWTGGKFRPHRDSIPDHPARSHSLYRLSYPIHVLDGNIHIFTTTQGDGPYQVSVFG